MHPSKLYPAKISHPIEPSMFKRTFLFPESATWAEKYTSVVQALSLPTPTSAPGLVVTSTNWITASQNRNGIPMPTRIHTSNKASKLPNYSISARNVLPSHKPECQSARKLCGGTIQIVDISSTKLPCCSCSKERWRRKHQLCNTLSWAACHWTFYYYYSVLFLPTPF